MRGLLLAAWVVLGAASGAACADAAGQTAQAGAPRILESVQGRASYYARSLHGDITASGAPMNVDALVAAHPSYPFGTIVRVTRIENQKSVEVTIIDRGPGDEPRREGVIIDLSRAAARALAMLEEGRTDVQLDVLAWGDDPHPPLTDEPAAARR